jgi:hypothetical protein
MFDAITFPHLHCCNTVPEINNYKEETFILAYVSEVSVHGHLALLLWGCVSKVHGGSAQQRSLVAAEKQRRGCRGPNISLKGMPPYLKVSPPPLSGDQAFNTWALGSIQDPNYNSVMEKKSV